MQLHTGVRIAPTKKQVCPWNTEAVPERSSLELLWVSDPGWITTVCTLNCVECLVQLCLLQRCYSLVSRKQCQIVGERSHLKRNRGNLYSIVRASAPTTWDLTPPSIKWWGSLRRWNVHTWFQLYPTISIPRSYKGDSCKHTLKKGVAWIHVKSSSINKTTGHTWTRNTPTKGQPFKITLGNCFTYLHRNRESSAKWEDRELCLNWRARLKTL